METKKCAICHMAYNYSEICNIATYHTKKQVSAIYFKISEELSQEITTLRPTDLSNDADAMVWEHFGINYP